MTPVFQEIPWHDPEEGLIGDCFRAALASLLDLPLHDVPHFTALYPNPVECQNHIHRFLGARDLVLVEIKAAGGVPAGEGIPDIYHLIFGTDPDQLVGHACVGLNGAIVHDPSPLQRGLVGGPSDWLFGFLLHTGAVFLWTEKRKRALKKEKKAAPKRTEKYGGG